MPRFITLITDFGVEEVYVGVMKGVIWGLNPDALITDLCHSIEPQNILQAAFLLHTAYPYFPPDTVHVVVVDPGVGSTRQAIALKTPFGLFVGPDNGVFSYVIDRIAAPPEEGHAALSEAGGLPLVQRKLLPPSDAVLLTQSRFWRHPVSHTFHGRDVFAPVAAHLSRGVPFELLGERITSLHAFPIPRPFTRPDQAVEGAILHIDRFGNLITNLTAEHLPKGQLRIEVAGATVSEFVRFYAEGHDLLALIGSSGYLEIAAKNASARDRLGARLGDPVVVRTG